MWRKVLQFALVVSFMVTLAPLALGQLPTAQAAPDVKTLYQRAIDLSKAGKYAEALTVMERTRKLIAKRFGHKHENHRLVQVRQAEIHNLYFLELVKSGKYAEAEIHAKAALAIREKVLGENHPDVATSLNNLAELYRTQQGRFELRTPVQ